MVPRPRAGDVEQMPLGVVDVLEIRLVSDVFDPGLQRDHFIVTGSDDDGVAREFSDWGDAGGRFSLADDGVREARDCARQSLG